MIDWQNIEGITLYLPMRNHPLFAIHNIVVVTSPIGDQAPPALRLI